METSELNEFSEIALEHAHNPRNIGPMPDPDGHARLTGPCGDTMEFWLKVRDARVEKATFLTDGCGSSLACGSMATCLARGKMLEDAAEIRQEDILDAFGEFPEDSQHCALLAANTLRAACSDYLARIEAAVKARTERDASSHCGGEGSSCRSAEEDEDERKLKGKLSRIRRKIVVLSGKGGVGKSTVAVNLAVALMLSGKRVGLLDVDIHGPSVPTMLGLEGRAAVGEQGEIVPVALGDLKVVSIGFFLRSQDDAVIWRGPMKMGVIKQFLKDVAWGDLDFLIVDSPPGTGDEPLSVIQLLGKVDGAVVVTTPQKVASVDVRKSVSFCAQLKVPVTGIVENMSGFACPKCGEVTPILCSGGGRKISEDMHVPFLGAIPIDPQIAQSCDQGLAFIHHYSDTPTAAAMRDIIRPIAAMDGDGEAVKPLENTTTMEVKKMRIAIPLADGRLAMHFGHCERFALIDTDAEGKKIVKREDIAAPPHEPGLLPKWLGDRGANVIIAGGMGSRAQGLFAERGIRVVTGAAADTPEQVAQAYLEGTLETGANVCDH